MSLLCRIFSVLVSTLFLVALLANGRQVQDSHIQITGTVIGRWHAGDLFSLPGGQMPEFILVRADESSQDLRIGQYIFVRYSRSGKQEDKLPKGFFDKMAQWQFTLRKIEGSDGPMRDILYSKSGLERDGTLSLLMDWVPGAEYQELPLDVVVPFYEAELGSIKSVSRK